MISLKAALLYTAVITIQVGLVYTNDMQTLALGNCAILLALVAYMDYKNRQSRRIGFFECQNACNEDFLETESKTLCV